MHAQFHGAFSGIKRRMRNARRKQKCKYVAVEESNCPLISHFYTSVFSSLSLNSAVKSC